MIGRIGETVGKKKKQGLKKGERSADGSWRSIRQNVSVKGETKHAKSRTRARTIRFVSGTTLVTLIVGGVATGIWHLDHGSESSRSKIKANPIEEIVVLTDGVLSDEWINQRLQIPPEVGLMEVDIQAIKDRLEADGQVEAATISRRFPTTLIVSLTERAPVARLATQQGNGPVDVFVVAVDGVVYRGFGYDRQHLYSLPFLDGIRLKRSGDRFAPISRLDDVVSLFSVARQIAPHLCREWRIVVLDRRPFVVIRTKEVEEIIFEPGAYRQQLARLDYILDHYRRMPGDRPSRIDLSFKNQAAVELAVSQNATKPKPVFTQN
jgi:cell division septal protein FtsQ